jgi:hypothetical protein
MVALACRKKPTCWAAIADAPIVTAITGHCEQTVSFQRASGFAVSNLHGYKTDRRKRRRQRIGGAC